MPHSPPWLTLTPCYKIGARRSSLLEKYLTTAQVQQAELNKSEVERMCVQLQTLLVQLQTACGDKWGLWNTFILQINEAVENNRREQFGGGVRLANSSLRHAQMKGMLCSLKNL